MKERKQTMKPSIQLLVALILVMPWPTSRIVSTADAQAVAQRDSVRHVLVRESMLRRATAVIDSLDMRLALETNRRVARDSTIVQQGRWYKAQYADVYEWGARWKQEATSWWTRHESAFWTMLGMIAAAWALN